MLLLLCAVIAGGSALVLGTTGALGGPSPNLFQLDGDATTQTSPAVGDDWDKVFAGTSGAFSSTFIPFSAEGPATDTTAWTPSTKVADPIDEWSWQTNTSVINAKGDITDAFAAAYKDGADTVMYFGLDRFDESGDANVGFWFLQDPNFSLNSDGTFSGGHVEGDVFIKSGFLQGGGIALPEAFYWHNGSLQALATGGLCTTAEQQLCAIDNDGADGRPGTITVPWEYQDKDGNAAGTIAPNGFFEGGINLGSLFGNAALPCFTNFIAQTATSAGNQETLKDIAAGSIQSCGTIQLKKHWATSAGNATLNIGKTAGAADVATATANGQDGATAETEVHAGTYFVSEIGPDANAYTSTLACFNDTNHNGTQDGSEPTVAPNGTGGVAVGVGDHVVCTYTNTAKKATLIVKKHVINDDGGSAAASAWSLHVKSGGSEVATSPQAGSESGTSYSVDAGTYTVSETGGPSGSGYHFDGYSVSCAEGQVTLAPGETKTCTLTNNDVGPTLTVIKHVINDDGGSAAASAWSLHVKSGGSEVATSPQAGTESGTVYHLNAGTYAVSETGGPSGYNFDGYTLDCNSDGQVTLAPGDNKTCKLTNNDVGATITVTKRILPSSDTGTFDFTIDPGEGQKVLDNGTDGYGNGDSTGAVDVSAGDHTVSESGNGTTSLADYASTWSCSSNKERSQSGTGTSISLGNLTLTENVTCTFTNTRLATLIVKKLVDNSNGGGSKGPGDFSIHVTAAGLELPGSPAAGSSSGTTYSGLMPGTYKVSEDAVSGYSLTSISGCLADGSVVLEAGATVTCTLTNTSPAPPPPSPPPAPPAPKVDIQITKTGAPNPATVGNQVTWTMVVTNNGPNGATGVTVADPVPAGTTFVSVASSAGTCTGTGGVVNCQLGSLAVGSSVTITLVTTASATGTLTNTATTVAKEQETNTANNTATASVVVNGPFVPPVRYCTALSVSPKKTLFVGSKTTLTLKVTQNGKAVKGIRIKIKGAALAITTTPSNAKGLVKVTLKPKKAGIVTFAPVSSTGCANPRIGVAGVFTPPVTG